MFGILWLTQFIIASQHVVIAGAIATWFFTRDKSRLGLPIGKSVWRLVRYHLGSVAFGSLIVALIKAVRLILKWVEKKIKKHKTLAWCKPILLCCQCCLWCFEKVIKFINKNAYIEVGTSRCQLGDGYDCR